MRTTVVLILLLSLGTAVFANPIRDDGLPPNANKKLIVDNLLMGLASDNLGLKVSCARMLGQIYAERATIPLMATLRNSEEKELRIAAAWALCRIGDGVGTYFVKQTARFEEDVNVQAVEAWYYNTYVQPGTFLVKMSPEVTISLNPELFRIKGFGEPVASLTD